MIPIKILLVVILAVWVGMQIGRLATLWELEQKPGYWKITKHAAGKDPEVTYYRAEESEKEE